MIFEKIIMGKPIAEWLIALAILITSFLIIKIVVVFLHKHLGKIAPKTENKLDDIFHVLFGEVKNYFILGLSIYLATLSLNFATGIELKIGVIFLLILLLQITFWGNAVISFFAKDYKSRHIENDGASVTTYSALAFAARLLLFSTIILVALDNLGFNVTTLIAGLGVGGIAIALAVQNILGDLFASLSIVVDKPFVLGDFIIVDNYLGVVEKIGLKTTRVKSLSGEQLVFSNNDLLQSRIRNFKRMEERRIAFSVGVTYQTPSEQLREIPRLMQSIIESHDNTRFDRAHFKEFGNFSLNFEMVYYIGSADYNIYMDIQQSINLKIFELFEQKGIEFAYPTQTLFLNKEQN